MIPSSFVLCLALGAMAFSGPAITSGSAPLEALPYSVGRALEAGMTGSGIELARTEVARAPMETQEDTLHVAHVASSLAETFLYAGADSAWNEAEHWVRRALELRRAVRGELHPEVAASWSALANVLDYRERWPEALEAARLALSIHVAIAGPRDTLVADDRLLIGALLYRLARLDEAQMEFEQALDVRTALTPTRAGVILEALNGLGEVQRGRGRHLEAESTYRRALEEADRALAADDPLWPYLLNNLAGVLKDQERFDEAEPLLRRSLDAVRLHPAQDPMLGPTSHLNLAEVLRLQGRDVEAGPLYREALRLGRSSLGAGSPTLAYYLNQLAVFERDAGRFEAAQPLFREALEVTTAGLGTNHPTRAQVLVDLAGQLRRRQGAGAEAESLLRVALDIRRRALGERHPEAAAVRIELGEALAVSPSRRPEARREIEAALDVLLRTPALPRERIRGQRVEAELLAESGRVQAAREVALQALGLVDSLRLTRGGGDDARVRLLQDHRALFDRVIDWSFMLGDTVTAFITMERSRARVLLDQLALAGLNLHAGMDPTRARALELEDRALRAALAGTQRRLLEVAWQPVGDPREHAFKLAQLDSERDSLVWALRRVEERTRQESPVWRRAHEAYRRIASPTDARSLIGDRGWLLSYHIGWERSHLLAIPPAGGPAEVWQLEADADAARRLRIEPGALTTEWLARALWGTTGASGSPGVLADLSNRPRRRTEAERRHAVPPSTLDRLQALRRLLVPDGLWSRLRASRAAVLIPDGPLHALPFEALVVDPRPQGNPVFWLDEGPALVYAPSVTAALGSQRRTHGSRQIPGEPEVLSVVDPDLSPGSSERARALLRAADASRRLPPGRDRDAGSTTGRGMTLWPPLPYARTEGQALVDAFGTARVRLLAGTQASEGMARRHMSEARIIHFATHGFIAEDRQHLLAGLALSPGPRSDEAEDDGLLQLYELTQLDLAADLVILAGCVTQAGAIADVEGPFALSRGFYSAGARNVIAALWSISDRATASLVSHLARDLPAAGISEAGGHHVTAVRDAKRAVRSRYEWTHPFYWAACILTGGF